MQKLRKKQRPIVILLLTLFAVAFILTSQGLTGYVIVSKTANQLARLYPVAIHSNSAVLNPNALTDAVLTDYSTFQYPGSAFVCPTGLNGEFTALPNRKCRFTGENSGGGNSTITFNSWVQTNGRYKKDLNNQETYAPTAQKIEVVYSDYGLNCEMEGRVSHCSDPVKLYIFAKARCRPEDDYKMRYVGTCTVRDGELRQTCTKPLGIGNNCLAYDAQVEKVIVAREDKGNAWPDPAVHAVRLLQQYTCKDSDHGQSVIDYGEVTITTPAGQQTRSSDTCTSASQVNEFYCTAKTGDNGNLVASTSLSCPSDTLCGQGKCQLQVPAPSATLHYPAKSKNSRSLFLYPPFGQWNSITPTSYQVTPRVADAGLLKYSSFDQNNNLIPLSCPAGFTFTDGACTTGTYTGRSVKNWEEYDLTSDSSSLANVNTIKVAVSGQQIGCSQCDYGMFEVYTTPSLTAANPVWTHKLTARVNANQINVVSIPVSPASSVEGVLIGRAASLGDEHIDPGILRMWVLTQ